MASHVSQGVCPYIDEAIAHVRLEAVARYGHGASQAVGDEMGLDQVDREPVQGVSVSAVPKLRVDRLAQVNGVLGAPTRNLNPHDATDQNYSHMVIAGRETRSTALGPSHIVVPPEPLSSQKNGGSTVGARPIRQGSVIEGAYFVEHVGQDRGVALHLVDAVGLQREDCEKFEGIVGVPVCGLRNANPALSPRVVCIRPVENRLENPSAAQRFFRGHFGQALHLCQVACSLAKAARAPQQKSQAGSQAQGKRAVVFERPLESGTGVSDLGLNLVDTSVDTQFSVQVGIARLGIQMLQRFRVSGAQPSNS
jgi:hypothetical protein